MSKYDAQNCALALGTNYQSYVLSEKTINGSRCRHYHQDVLDISFSGINKIIWVSNIANSKEQVP